MGLSCAARTFAVLAGGATAIALAGIDAAHAQTQQADQSDAPARPAILFNRWQEDWSVLADPRTPHEPLDGLKYIPLDGDPKTYLSFGGEERVRYENNDATGFSTPGNRKDDYVIERTELDADLHVDAVQAFVQIESAYAPGKARLTPVDQDNLDLEQAFAAVVEPVGDDVLKVRIGRQQFAFDLQRFVSVRDGPNVRQSYDAVWADYEMKRWRFIGYWSQPVQNRDLRPFDDYSSGHLTFGGLRVERKVFGDDELSAYWSQYTQDNAVFGGRRGDERRQVFDVRFAGTYRALDWDLEAMGQTGRFAGERIAAWAVGTRAGYSFQTIGWRPRLGLQVDAASGDDNPGDKTLGTFNPLFPNGYYVTLAGYTGYVNFVHLKPLITLHPLAALMVTAAAAAQWRETTQDAVYSQPDIPVAGTAGRPGAYTGAYGQLRLDYQINPHLSAAVEAVHFKVAEVIRQVGGHDSDYLGVELKAGW